MKKLSVNLLYVDDEICNLQGFVANYRRDYNVFTAISGNEAKAILCNNEIHILITDQRMPEVLGTQLLEQMVEEYPNQIRILLTAFGSSEAIHDAQKRGFVFRCLNKPYKPSELKEIIDEAYEHYLAKKNKDVLSKELLKTLEEIELLKKKNGLK